MSKDNAALLSAIVPRLSRGNAKDAQWPDRSGEYWALCPFHTDTKVGSFSVSERGYACMACGESGGLGKLARHLGVEIEDDERGAGLTLAQYAAAKHLPVDFLQRVGVRESKSKKDSRPYITFGYKDEHGAQMSARFRYSMSERPKGRTGVTPELYGLWRLPLIRKLGWVLLVEGESDAQTAWLASLPAIGMPGASTWKTEWSSYFADLDVYVWREPDLGGKTLTASLLAALPNAKIICAPEGIKDISQAHIAGQDVAALVESLRARAAPILAFQAEVGVPEIVGVNRPMHDITNDVLAALMAANAAEPTIFVRSGALARVTTDEHGEPIIGALDMPALRGNVDRCAGFVRFGKEGETVPMLPPVAVMQDILSLGKWDFPALAGITETPIVTPSGKIATEPGYNAETKLVYIPNGFARLPVSDAPTTSDVLAAVELLKEIICDFPFDGEASRANALAAILTAALRPAIDGPAPLVLFDKPQPGTGASLLAEVVSTIATGRATAMLAAPQNDEEWEKRITALLRQGRTVITIDNIEGMLVAAPLASALTSNLWSGRILGLSEMITLPQRATWIATGNNIRLGGDLPRRCYWVRMDAKSPRPWERGAYRHPNLREWVKDERGRILAAILTLARAWFCAGRPVPEAMPIMGSFEGWTQTIGGVLAFAGINGFLENLNSMYEMSDEEGPAWEAFTSAWYTAFGGKGMTLNDVAAAASQSPEFKEVIPDGLLDQRGELNVRKLGKALSKRADTRYLNGLMIKKGGAYKSAVKWQVKPTSTYQPAQQTMVSGEFGEFGEFVQPQLNSDVGGTTPKTNMAWAGSDSPNSPNSPTEEIPF